MNRHAYNSTCLTLALIALLHLSSSSASRRPRSIWPLWSSAPEEAQGEPLISEKHADIMRQAGYAEYLDLSKHPLWKVHKYEGIDLKPVRLAESEATQVDARNPVSSVAPLTESADGLPDLSFLDNLGGLAYFLPEPEDDEDERENEKASILATTIANEDVSHPGFFAKIWSKIWGSADKQEKPIDQGIEISLPATRQHYAEIGLIKPANTTEQASEYASNASSGAVVVQPAVANDGQFSRTRAYVQSWNPNAAYSLHVEGPAEYPAEHVATVHTYTANNFLQRKSAEDTARVVSPVEKIIDVPSNHSQAEQQQVVESTTTPSSEQIERDNFREAIAKVLSMNFLPKLMVNKLKDIDRLLAEKEPTKESIDKLRKLQADFEKRKHQLGSVYPALRKLFPSQN